MGRQGCETPRGPQAEPLPLPVPQFPLHHGVSHMCPGGSHAELHARPDQSRCLSIPVPAQCPILLDPGAVGSHSLGGGRHTRQDQLV